jgi:hypothetical protein
MTIQDLRKYYILDGEQADILKDDRPLPEGAYASPIYPSNPDYSISVYYDASRFPNEQAIQDLSDRLQLQYAPRRIGLEQIDPKSLEYRSLSPFRKMEKLFLDRGFVADVEARMFGQGVRDTKFVQRNKQALNENSKAMAILLLEHGHCLLPPALDGEIREETVDRALAPILGKETVRKGQTEPDPSKIYPLAEHQGLLLGCTDFTPPRRLHWATETTPGQVIDKGDRKEAKVALFEHKMASVRNQLLFEFEHAPQLLRENFLDPELNGAGVSRAMVLTWYSQVIAATRKVCWLASGDQEASVVAQSIYEEREVHGKVIGVSRLPEIVRTWGAYIAHETRERHSEITNRAVEWGPILGLIDMTYEVSWENEILAALMGATYRSDTDPTESPFQNRDIFVRCLAYWIGSLKRKRTATINWYTAEGILEVCRGKYSSSVLLSQFPKATWAKLEQIAEALANNDPDNVNEIEIEVSYTWTRDLHAPYKCEERDGTLALEGPLLCFPVLAAAEWREKARTIATLRGFEVKGPRRR